MFCSAKYITCFLLLYTHLAFAQSPDTTKQKTDNYTFIGLMPSFAGIVTFGQPQANADIYIPGMNLSYGKTKDKLRYGVVLGYKHYFIKGWKDANEYTIGRSRNIISGWRRKRPGW